MRQFLNNMSCILTTSKLLKLRFVLAIGDKKQETNKSKMIHFYKYITGNKYWFSS